MTESARTDRSALTALFDAAFHHHQAGRAIPAGQLYRHVLCLDPAHGKALLLFGMLLAERAATSEILLRRSLTLLNDAGLERGTALFELARQRQNVEDDAAAIPLFEAASRLLANSAAVWVGLALSLQRLARGPDAQAAIIRALAIDPLFAPCHFNHGNILGEMQQAEAAEASFRLALVLAPGWGEAWSRLGETRQTIGSGQTAETPLRRAIAIDGNNVQALFRLAQSLERRKCFDEASALNIAAGRRHGVQRHPCRAAVPLARILLIGGAGSCNLPPQFLFDQQRYELLTTYLLPPDAEGSSVAALAARLPPFDIAFNAIADLDRGADFFAQAAALSRLLACPLLNPPDARIERTRRDQIGAVLAGVDGLLLPRTRCLSRELLSDERILEKPLLARPVGAHGGEGLRRLDQSSQLEDYLRETPEQNHYLPDFVDFVSADGFYRKYRFIFVDREVYPYHLAIGGHWLLHYISSDMNSSAAFRQEEERFLADWRAAIPAAACGAVDEIARRLDLDYAGIDCAVSKSGELILFEANPCMLVHLRDSPQAYGYKHRYVPRIADAIDRLVQRRLASDAQNRDR